MEAFLPQIKHAIELERFPLFSHSYIGGGTKRKQDKKGSDRIQSDAGWYGSIEGVLLQIQLR